MKLATAVKRLENLLAEDDNFESIIAECSYSLHCFFHELPDLIGIHLNDCLISTAEDVIFVLDLLYETRRTGWYEAVLFVPNLNIFPTEKDRLFTSEYIASVLKDQIPGLEMLRVKFFAVQSGTWWTSKYYEEINTSTDSIVNTYVNSLNNQIFTPNYSNCAGCEFSDICTTDHLHPYSLCRKNKVREEIENEIQTEIKDATWIKGASAKISKTQPVNQNEQFV